MPAVKSTNHINVSGTGNTLASITTDIADTTFIESKGGGVYTVKCNVDRGIILLNGGELSIGDADDFATYERLEFETNTANARGYLRVDAGSSLKMYGNTALDFASGSFYGNNITWAGAVYITGSDEHKPTLYNMWSTINFQEITTANTFPNDIWTLNNVRFGNARSTNGYVFRFNMIGRYRNHSFTNIHFTSSVGGIGITQRGFAWDYSVPGSENVYFENFNFDYGTTGGYLLTTTVLPPVRYRNFTFGNSISNWKTSFDRPEANKETNGIYNFDTPARPDNCQIFTLLDTWTFKHNPSATNSDILARWGANLCLLSCSFEGTNGTRLYVQAKAKVMMWGTSNTFVSEAYTVWNNGYIHWVYDLKVNVMDRNGNPIDNALVSIVQNQNKESFVFNTNSEGKLNDLHKMNVALLTSKQQYGNNPTTNADFWSDNSNSTYHTVTVIKDGYRPSSTQVVMNAARELNIYLDRIDARSLSF